MYIQKLIQKLINYNSKNAESDYLPNSIDQVAEIASSKYACLKIEKKTQT